MKMLLEQEFTTPYEFATNTNSETSMPETPWKRVCDQFQASMVTFSPSWKDDASDLPLSHEMCGGRE
jgi:hypothetical protein